MLTESTSYALPKGAFFNYVDKILVFFDHLPTPGWHLWRNSFKKRENPHTVVISSNTYLPRLVDVIWERPTPWKKAPLIAVVTMYAEIAFPLFACIGIYATANWFFFWAILFIHEKGFFGCFTSCPQNLFIFCINKTLCLLKYYEVAVVSMSVSIVFFDILSPQKY